MAKLWGGRFSKKTHKLVEEFSNSIHFDQKLAEYDCIGSLYHIKVLRKAGLLTAKEHTKLRDGLKSILKSIETGSFFKKIDDSFEDIHSYIQALLEKKVGKVALKLHTCRSRNDQVVFATKLYCLDNALATQELLEIFTDSLMALAKKNKDVILPGYTHLQHAIPVKLTSYFDAYGEMFMRDHGRLENALGNINLTLGSGALAGTFIPATNYDQSTKMGSGDITRITAPDSAIDTVSDRDFIIELLSALAITGMHLSRLAEDMILWASQEFNFIDIDDSFCTGSSLMPQKKNPDVLELIRGYSGKLYGNLTSVLVLMKGLPLTYNRDMQLDKEPLFESFEIVQKELKVLTELFKNVAFKKKNIAAQLDDETLYATDIADHLVQNGVAFKEAHAIVGRLVSHKLTKDTPLVKMTTETLKKFHSSLTPKVIKRIVNPKTSVAGKKSVKEKKT